MQKDIIAIKVYSPKNVYSDFSNITFEEKKLNKR